MLTLQDRIEKLRMEKGGVDPDDIAQAEAVTLAVRQEEQAKPYTVTETNLKRGVFKVCELGEHHKCQTSATHRFAQPENNMWNYQCTCPCHPTAFGDDSAEFEKE